MMFKNLFQRKKKSESSRVSLDSIPLPEEMAALTSEQRRILSIRINDLLANEMASLTAEQQRALKERWRALLTAEMDTMTPEGRRAVKEQYEALKTLPPEQRRALENLMMKK